MKRGIDTESETSHRNHQVSGMEEKTASARGGQPAPSPGVNGEQVRSDGAKRPLTTPLGKSGRKMNSRRMPPGSAVVPVGSEAGLEWSGWSLVPDFAMRLAREFGLGAEWLSRFIWFLAFVALLAPAFLKVAVFYLLNPRVKRSIVFGVLPRNRLDIISPPSSVPRPPRGFPVVVFVTGGAWLIGYKGTSGFLHVIRDFHLVLVFSVLIRDPSALVKTDMIAWMDSCDLRLSFSFASLASSMGLAPRQEARRAGDPGRAP